MSKKSRKARKEKKTAKAAALTETQHQEKIKEYIRKMTRLPGEWKEIKLQCPHCNEEDFCYAFEDKKTLFCMACSREFDVSDIPVVADTEQDIDVELIPEETHCYLSDEFAAVTAEANKQLDRKPPINQLKLPGVSTGEDVKKLKEIRGFGHYENNWVKSCDHYPQHVIAGTDRKWGVWAGKKDDCKASAHQYNVVLNLTYGSIKQTHDIPIPELSEFSDWSCPYKEIRLDWPDYGIVYLPRSFWEKLTKYLVDNGYKMLVFCQGGHGRTGTAIACLMVVGLGFTTAEAVTWVRNHYCKEAIETQGQINYIKQIEAAGKQNVKMAKAGEDK